MKYFHRWYLRHGYHVPLFSVGIWLVGLVSQTQEAVHYVRIDHHVFIAGTELAEHNGPSSHREPGRNVCSWRRAVL